MPKEGSGTSSFGTEGHADSAPSSYGNEVDSKTMNPVVPIDVSSYQAGETQSLLNRNTVSFPPGVSSVDRLTVRTLGETVPASADRLTVARSSEETVSASSNTQNTAFDKADVLSLRLTPINQLGSMGLAHAT